MVGVSFAFRLVIAFVVGAVCIVQSGIRPTLAQPDSVPADSTEKPLSGREIWTDNTGEHSIEAEFLGFRRNLLRLRKSDGAVVEVPATRMGALSAARARELAGLTGELLPLPEIKKSEKSLVFPARILELYRRLLADENIAPKDLEFALARVAELEQAEAQGKVLIEDRFEKIESFQKGIERAFAMLAEADQAIARQEWGTVIKRLEAASRADPLTPHPNLLLGLVYSIRQRSPTEARKNGRESLRRCRFFGDLREGDAAELEVAIVNNLALAHMKMRELDKSAELWADLARRGRPASPELIHNIGHALHYARIAGDYPAYDFFSSDVKKLQAHAQLLQDWAGIQPVGGNVGWKYMWIPPVRDGNPVQLHSISPADLHDNACLGCDGTGVLQCPGCAGSGTVSVRVPKPKQFGDKIIYIEEVEIRKCGGCAGRGTVDCPYCSDGRESLPR